MGLRSSDSLSAGASLLVRPGSFLCPMAPWLFDQPKEEGLKRDAKDLCSSRAFTATKMRQARDGRSGLVVEALVVGVMPGAGESRTPTPRSS